MFLCRPLDYKHLALLRLIQPWQRQSITEALIYDWFKATKWEGIFYFGTRLLQQLAILLTWHFINLLIHQFAVMLLLQAWSILKKFFKSKSKLIESKFSEPKSKSVFIESVFYIFVFDFGIISIILKNYDSIYFDTKFNRCYFNKYRIVSVL